ncbi:putative oxidoreductase [Purpureocillium lavendulum]|uniref:Oxidoreductase n=1 Tax=Purpureocillium lavendulum TaxID=1247861 RepID=A0AB34G3Q7_9HYPO|nr:putative oxidoreductase [Purpureocillium lavendulum]
MPHCDAHPPSASVPHQSSAPTMPTGFDPARDIPDLKGKVFLVTGGTAGLGLQTVEALAAHAPAHVCFMGRNATKAAAVVEGLRARHPDASVSFVRCDMASLASVRDAARAFLAAGHGRLDVLVCNAGIMCVDAAVTAADGYQVEWQTNHLGHALLIKLLLPLLRATAASGGADGGGADVRIVNLTSQAYRQAPHGGIDFATLRTPQETLGNALIPGHRWSRYGQSKLANMLYADALAARHPELLCVSVHPGYIFTDLFTGVPFFTKLPVFFIAIGQTLQVDEGAHNQLWAATAPRDAVKTGTYYEPVGVAARRTTAYSNDAKLADKLWDWTEEALKDYSRTQQQPKTMSKPYDPADHLVDAYRSARLQYVRADAADERFLAFVPQLEQDPVIQAHAAPTALQPKGRRHFEEYAAGVAAATLGVMICLLPEEEAARQQQQQQGKQQQQQRSDEAQKTLPQQQPQQRQHSLQQGQKADGEQQQQQQEQRRQGEEDKTEGSPPQPPTIVGVICLGWGGANPATAHHRGSHIGVSLAAAHQGRGYGREAIDWMLDWAFRHAGLHTVAISAASYNARACALYERMGFAREGRRRETIWMDRRWHDEIEFGMTEGEWEALRGTALDDGDLIKLVPKATQLLALALDAQLDQPGQHLEHHVLHPLPVDGADELLHEGAVLGRNGHLRRQQRYVGPGEVLRLRNLDVHLGRAQAVVQLRPVAAGHGVVAGHADEQEGCAQAQALVDDGPVDVAVEVGARADAPVAQHGVGGRVAPDRVPVEQQLVDVQAARVVLGQGLDEGFGLSVELLDEEQDVGDAGLCSGQRARAHHGDGGTHVEGLEGFGGVCLVDVAVRDGGIGELDDGGIVRVVDRDDDVAVAGKGARTGRVGEPRGAEPGREEDHGMLGSRTAVLAGRRLGGELAVLNVEAGEGVVGEAARDGLLVVERGRQRWHQGLGLELARMTGLVDREKGRDDDAALVLGRERVLPGIVGEGEDARCHAVRARRAWDGGGLNGGKETGKQQEAHCESMNAEMMIRHSYEDDVGDVMYALRAANSQVSHQPALPKLGSTGRLRPRGTRVRDPSYVPPGPIDDASERAMQPDQRAVCAAAYDGGGPTTRQRHLNSMSRAGGAMVVGNKMQQGWDSASGPAAGLCCHVFEGAMAGRGA